MLKTKTTSLMLATGLAGFAFVQPALALDAEAFVKRIETVYATMGYTLDFGAATASGDTVTVDGVTVSLEGTPESFSFDTELTFSGVTEFEDGSYTADSLTVPDVDTEFATDPVGHVTFTDILVSDIWLPPEGDVTIVDALQAFASITTGPLSVTRDGEEVIAIESMSLVSDFTYDANDALEQANSDLQISGIWADLSTVSEEEPEAGAVIEALGLTEINGSISQISSWNVATGDIVMDEFLFDFADIGALDITMDLGGFTPAVMDKIYDLSAASAEATSEEAQAQQMMVGMELLQALSLTSVSVRYDDASLAGKLLDMFAAQSGVERAEFVEMLKGMVPDMVNEAGIPPLTDLVVPAVNAFLDDPQNFEVAVRPSSPTSLLVLSAAAANPAGLISALGLTVTANQPAE
ncbi:MAG: hypothetical protein KIT02_09210 [Devosia sp.]|uniref:hypothetical protein n=1 Tax=Devosia sp. TaxID=1871048 RepID=UPI0024C860F1|nr:hypothetical protein [Devosia sp.]UYN98160.1 MAG: hypothetical protein KIT02_09210 [Devosia sp.]